MYEVHAGSKPGRPALLLVLVGAALIGSLGLAWIQTQTKLALGDPHPLPGTPLNIRSPRGWTAVPDAPGVFVQADEQHRSLQRCVIFSYAHFPRFQTPESVIKNWKWRGDALRTPPNQLHSDSWVATPLVETTLAGWPAVEIKRRRTVRVVTRGDAIDYAYSEDRILRVACHPRGDMIAVEYVPAFEIARGDVDLMEALCQGIEFSDPALKLRGDAAMKAAGVQFPVDDAWMLFGPDYVQAPAVRVLGRNDKGLPGWSVDVHRTWLSNSRSAADVLVDHISAKYSGPIDPGRVVEWGRLDRMQVAFLSVPFRMGIFMPHAAYLLWTSEQDAVLISVDGDTNPIGPALDAAEKLANSLTFTAADGWPDIAAAQERGRTCATKFSQRGGLPWWDAPLAQTHFFGEYANTDAARIEYHQAIDGNPRRGFVGGSAYLSSRSNYHLRERWTVDGVGVEYTWSIRQGKGDESLPGVSESRRPGSNVVNRHRGKDEEFTFTVGDRFVCPPLESLAEAWAARNGTGDCLIDVSCFEGRGVSSRLIRQLPGEKTGTLRVLMIDDYSPRGRIAAYDDKMERQLDAGPAFRLNRIEPGETAKSVLFQRLRKLMAD